ncbi:MAG TPA: vWA domain-containing protein [Gammaproteobacteria bacterium]|nr:vWA domain-containing protein [Gammaproteobacteria bacterium]
MASRVLSVRALAAAVLVAAAALAAACGPPSSSHNSGVYLLLDTSGTYSQELDKAQQIINYTLSRLEPGDSFAVARIDTGSFSEKDIIAKVTLDDRPSAANMQKRQFSKKVAEFLDHVQPAKHTDITGGLLQAVEFLNEKQPGRKTVLIFSDLEEDLEKGYVRNVSVSLRGFEVVALNVTKLRTDNLDPRKYLDRLEAWRKRVEQQGGSWRVMNDLDRLSGLLSS